MKGQQTLASASLKNLVLFGYKSSGKTYFGKRLASLLGRPFIDSDQKLEELYAHRFHENLFCREIMRREGESFFRSLEYEVIVALSQVKGAIIALGGGAVLREDSRDEVKSMGTLVYLDVDKEVLKARMLAPGMLTQNIPSFLDQEHPEESFERMYKLREPIYNLISEIKVTVAGKSDSEVLGELKALADIQ